MPWEQPCCLSPAGCDSTPHHSLSLAPQTVFTQLRARPSKPWTAGFSGRMLWKFSPTQSRNLLDCFFSAVFLHFQRTSGKLKLPKRKRAGDYETYGICLWNISSFSSSWWEVYKRLPPEYLPCWTSPDF